MNKKITWCKIKFISNIYRFVVWQKRRHCYTFFFKVLGQIISVFFWGFFRGGGDLDVFDSNNTWYKYLFYLLLVDFCDFSHYFHRLLRLTLRHQPPGYIMIKISLQIFVLSHIFFIKLLNKNVFFYEHYLFYSDFMSGTLCSDQTGSSFFQTENPDPDTNRIQKWESQGSGFLSVNI